MPEALEWHIDGTFKKSPKIFLQPMTIQTIIKKYPLNSAFVFCQKKTRNDQALIAIKNECLELLQLTLASLVILLVFEVSMQQTCILAFINVKIKGKYKPYLCI